MDDWFFNMGGRGSLESRGSRQKNALLSAGLISILGELYGDQFQMIKPNKLVRKIQRKIKKLHQKMINQLNLLMKFLMKFLEILF